MRREGVCWVINSNGLRLRVGNTFRSRKRYHEESIEVTDDPSQAIRKRQWRDGTEWDRPSVNVRGRSWVTETKTNRVWNHSTSVRQKFGRHSEGERVRYSVNTLLSRRVLAGERGPCICERSLRQTSLKQDSGGQPVVLSVV